MPTAPSPGRSRLLFALLYLGEGVPIGFIWWALPTWLRVQGLPIDQITALTGLLVLPWVGKFLWAPLVDRIRDTRRRLRGCVVAAQLVMGATLLPLTWLKIAEEFSVVRLLLIMHALAAVTQDVAVDALALRIVPPSDRGRQRNFCSNNRPDVSRALNLHPNMSVLTGSEVLPIRLILLEQKVPPILRLCRIICIAGDAEQQGDNKRQYFHE